MPILVLQHVACEALGAIESSLDRAGLSFEYRRPFLGEPVPTSIGSAAGLIVMGGPMGAYEHEQFPHLRDETRLIESVLHANRPMLGVCLGSQLLAHALGAKVYPGQQKEIGWHRVTLTAAAQHDRLWQGTAQSFVPLHWHGDVFDLPARCELLARSDLTAHQAFRYGDRAYATLFHLETTRPQLLTMIDTFADELRAAGLSGQQITAEADEHLPALEPIGRTIFDRWATLAAGN